MAFTCLKPDCGFNTSGFVRDITSNERWCPKCLSPLIQCDHCRRYVSGTRAEDGTTMCDHCGCKVVLEYARLKKPWHTSLGWDFPKKMCKYTTGIEPVDFKCIITIDGVLYEL